MNSNVAVEIQTERQQALAWWFSPEWRSAVPRLEAWKVTIEALGRDGLTAEDAAAMLRSNVTFPEIPFFERDQWSDLARLGIDVDGLVQIAVGLQAWRPAWLDVSAADFIWDHSRPSSHGSVDADEFRRRCFVTPVQGAYQASPAAPANDATLTATDNAASLEDLLRICRSDGAEHALALMAAIAPVSDTLFGEFLAAVLEDRPDAETLMALDGELAAHPALVRTPFDRGRAQTYLQSGYAQLARWMGGIGPDEAAWELAGQQVWGWLTAVSDDALAVDQWLSLATVSGIFHPLTRLLAGPSRATTRKPDWDRCRFLLRKSPSLLTESTDGSLAALELLRAARPNAGRGQLAAGLLYLGGAADHRVRSEWWSALSRAGAGMLAGQNQVLTDRLLTLAAWDLPEPERRLLAKIVAGGGPDAEQ